MHPHRRQGNELLSDDDKQEKCRVCDTAEESKAQRVSNVVKQDMGSLPHSTRVVCVARRQRVEPSGDRGAHFTQDATTTPSSEQPTTSSHDNGHALKVDEENNAGESQSSTVHVDWSRITQSTLHPG